MNSELRTAAQSAFEHIAQYVSDEDEAGGNEDDLWAALDALRPYARTALASAESGNRGPLVHDNDCPARDLCECGADGYREWAARTLATQPQPAVEREGLDAQLASIPRLRLTGEQIDSIEPPPDGDDQFAIDWDEYEEFVPWSVIEAALATQPSPERLREALHEHDYRCGGGHNASVTGREVTDGAPCAECEHVVELLLAASGDQGEER